MDVGPFETRDLLAGAFCPDRILLSRNFTQNCRFADFQQRFGEVGFGLSKRRAALFGAGTIIGLLLPYLVGEVFKTGGSFSSRVHLRDGVELRNEVARFDDGSIGNQTGQR